MPHAGAQRQGARDRLQQRRFAGAVGAEEPDAVAGQDVPVEVREYRRRVGVAQRRFLEPDQLLRGRVHGREGELEGAVDVRRRDALHAFQRLDPALRLLRLGGLGAEPVDERLQMRDLALLLGVGRLLQRELHRALAFELRIVSAVGLEALRVEVDDGGRPRRRGNRGRG